MAKSQSVSKSTINNIWQAHNLKPHRVETFKLSRDPVPLHLVMDNYGTHKHENVRNWLERHPRFVLHFVPTSSSWLNLVERRFGHLDGKAIWRGVFRSAGDLRAAMDSFLITWNQDPQPFVWTTTVQAITEKLSRCHQTLEKIQPGCTNPPVRRRQR